MGFFETVQHIFENVGKNWEKSGYDPDLFSSISVDALAEVEDLPNRFSESAFTDWLVDGKNFPPQLDPISNFGNPPITLFNDLEKGFVAEVYFWAETDSTIHDHNFAGAFMPLVGRNMHVLFQHRLSSESDNLKVKFGELALDRIVSIQPGEIVPICRGSSFIHQVCHVNRPVISLILRTSRDSGTVRNYLPGGFSVADDSMSSIFVNKTLRYANYLRKFHEDRVAPFLNQFVMNNDVGTSLHLFTKVVDAQINEEWIQVLLNTIATFHGVPRKVLQTYCLARWSLKTYMPMWVFAGDEAAQLREVCTLIQGAGFDPKVFRYLDHMYPTGAISVLRDSFQLLNKYATGDWRFYPALVSMIDQLLIDPRVDVVSRVCDEYQLLPEQIELLNYWCVKNLVNECQLLKSEFPTDSQSGQVSTVEAVAAHIDSPLA